MLLDHRSPSRPIAACALAGAATFLTIGGSFLIAKGSIGVALLVAAPLAVAEVSSPSSQAHLADEPTWGPFVYERLGATPRVQFGRPATAAVARVESLGAWVQARPAAADRASVTAGSQTVSSETPPVERRSRD